MAQKLFVGGLAFNTTEEGLHEFFAQAGEVTSAAIVADHDTGHSRGFGSRKVELAKPKVGSYATSGSRGFSR